MQNWGILILVVAVFVANLPAVMQQWRADRPGVIKTLWLMAAYALYVALGIAFLLLLAPRQPGESKALYPQDARPGEGRPPIVALTANAFAEDRNAYLEAGLDDYLAKPFEKADLAALFARWRPGVRPEGRTGLGAA